MQQDIKIKCPYKIGPIKKDARWIKNAALNIGKKWHTVAAIRVPQWKLAMTHVVDGKLPYGKVVPKYIPLHEGCPKKEHIGIDGDEQTYKKNKKSQKKKLRACLTQSLELSWMIFGCGQNTPLTLRL